MERRNGKGSKHDFVTWCRICVAFDCITTVYSSDYSPLCIAGQLSCILRLECKHIITVTHTKFTPAI